MAETADTPLRAPTTSSALQRRTLLVLVVAGFLGIAVIALLARDVSGSRA